VNPQHSKGLDGRKTDRRDAQWIAELLEDGRLKGSFVPPREIRELRDLTRQRVHTLEDRTRVRNRIEQLCQANNIKVSSVATDLFGLSGRSMLKALVEGKRDAGWMADYARGTLRKKRQLESALDGTFTAEQRRGRSSPRWESTCSRSKTPATSQLGGAAPMALPRCRYGCLCRSSSGGSRIEDQLPHSGVSMVRMQR